MKKEKSCGAIVYTVRDGQILYLLVKEDEKVYSFPKGHMEDGETEDETAMREIFEETGLKLQVSEDFYRTESYELSEKPGVTKEVAYFLAEYTDAKPHILLPDEIKGLAEVPLEEAAKLLRYENKRQILTEAEEFIRKRHNL